MKRRQITAASIFTWTAAVSHGSAARLGAWAIFAVSAVLLVIGALVDYSTPSGFHFFGVGASLTMILNASLCAFVGAIVVDRKQGHPVGWLFSIAGLGWAAHVMGASYARYALAFQGRRLPLQDLGIWSSSWTPLLAVGCVPAVLLFVFPTGRFSSARWRWAAVLGAGAAALGVLGSAFAPGPYQDFPVISNPFGAGGAVGEAMIVFEDTAWPLLILTFLLGARNLRGRMRTGGSTERDQIKWLLLAGLGMTGFVGFWGLSLLLGSQEAAQSISGLVISLLPISVGIAMMRHRLYDIDLILNRTLVYGALTGILALLYLGAVVLFQQLLSPATADSDLAVAASTLAVAALFRPLRSRVQSFIDRRFYRRKYDAAETLSDFSVRLRSEIDLDALGGELLSVVRDTVEPAHARLWLRPGEETR